MRWIVPNRCDARAGRIYNWPTRRFVDTTRDLSFVTYARALRIAGVHSAPALLKMDIEGYECVRTLALMRVGSLVKAVHDMT